MAIDQQFLAMGLLYGDLHWIYHIFIACLVIATGKPTEVYEGAFAMTWKPPLKWRMSIRSLERERVLAGR
jgi:hypothetical protein